MNPTQLLKRTPKWALYTGGGVIIGGFALRMYRNRTSSASEDDGTATIPEDAQTIGSPTYGLPSGSPGPILSPVVVGGGGSSDQSGTGLGHLQDLYSQGVEALLTQYGIITSQSLSQSGEVTQALIGPVSGAVGTVSAIAAAAAAGAAPAPMATPVITPVPAPAPAPQPAPPVAAPKPCSGEFPFQSSRGCYKIACASGNGARRKGRWHLYKAGQGPDQWIRSEC